MGVMIERFAESLRVFITVILIKIVYSSLSSSASLSSLHWALASEKFGEAAGVQAALRF